MEFGGILEGSPISLVCKMKIFDITHERHIMVADHTEVTFGFSGLLDFGHDSYTLLDAEFVKQFPVPLVKATHETKVMYHDLPSWHNLHELIDVCSGFGGMSQGAHAGVFSSRWRLTTTPGCCHFSRSNSTVMWLWVM